MNKIPTIICVFFLMQSFGLTLLENADAKEKMEAISDKNITLSADNLLLMSTFLGGSYNDGNYYTGVNIAEDSEGNIFIIGTTSSPDFPVNPNSYSQILTGETDVFIGKFNDDLTELLASTYIGGSSNEEARAVKIDENGNIIVCGITESEDFPITQNVFQSEYHDGTESSYGSGDAFIIIINNNLNEILSSTFLGGSGHETCSSIGLDSYGNIIVSGSTSSNDFPITENAYDDSYSSGGNLKDDVFVAKISSDLSELIASTYLGSNHDDFSEALSIGSSNQIFIAGWTGSSNFPTTSGAYDESFAGGYYDGFISCLNEDCSNLLSSTYIGGNQWDFCYSIELDHEDNIYVSGHTASRNYPITENAYCTTYQGIGGAGTGDDAFLSKLTPDLSTLLQSTYLGGDRWEMGYSIEISNEDFLYVAGTTSSSDFPTLNSYDHSYHGGSTHYGYMFLSCLTLDLSSVLSSTYLGGSGDENSGMLLIQETGNVVISGSSTSLDFPVIDTAYDSSHNGDADVFISIFQAGLCDENEAPEKPQLEGPSTGKVGESLVFTASTEDNNGNDVWFMFEWGDDTISKWIGPYTIGETCNVDHSWVEKDEYTVRVKAKDGFGLESEWSDSMIVSMPKTKELNLIQLLLEILVDHFPFIENLLCI